jgi:hypothetical protein
MRLRMILTAKPRNVAGSYGLGSMGPSLSLTARATFRDAQNYRWKRYSDGPLEQLKGPELCAVAR